MSQASDDYDADSKDLKDVPCGDVPALSTQPSSPTKPWRSPAVASPSTPSNERGGSRRLVGADSPSTPSRPSRNEAGSRSVGLSRPMRAVAIVAGSPIPFPKLSFGSGSESAHGSEEQVSNMLQKSSAMGPPAMGPPRPLKASSTSSSLESADSTNDFFFTDRSRTSSASSLESLRRSPLKRGPEGRATSPSPSKSRKLSQTQQAGSQAKIRPPLETLPSFHAATPPPESTFSLAALFGGNYASQLEMHIIAHSTEVQTHFDKIGVELGVQWELARGVLLGRWTWKDVEDKCKKQYNAFKGTNSLVAEQVSALMRGRPLEKVQLRNLSLWNEVDREHLALIEGKSRGLGLMGRWEHWDGQSDYYGGQILFPLRLLKSREGQYQICLEKPRRGRSHRFARELGSPNVLQLSIPSTLVKDNEGATAVKDFLAKRFVINGRIYVAIPPKDKSSVYLIQINQDYHRTPLPWYGDHLRVSFEDFLQRHNPPNLNAHQPFAKYTARFALGLSTSTPVLEFEKNNIIYIQDVLAEGWDPTKKPPSEKIMSDGCGFINREGLLQITNRVGYASRPTAIQGRIGGAKGLWILHPTDRDPNPKIWIRDSQLKIRLEGDLRVHRIFDLLRASHPAQIDGRHELSEQSILCLSSNGVPKDTLVSLLVAGLEQTVQPLLDWGVGAMPSLCRAVSNAGNVAATRLQRIAGSKSRVLGYRDRDRDEAEGELEKADSDDDVSMLNRSGRDMSGGPLGLHEQAIELIQAGFHPLKSTYLNDKMRYVIKTRMDSIVDKYRISLPESTGSDAFVIPDPFGILKENEIYYRSSTAMKNPATQTLFHVLSGPVILGRYPIRLPCDMRMVNAVDYEELEDYSDVIITSTAGDRSLLSVLSGGDYDGDTVIFIWLKEFLTAFKNQPFTPPPHGFEDNFERDVKTVEEVGNELRCKSAQDAQQTFHQYLLTALRDSQVGLYSMFHGISIRSHGYNDLRSILMAYIGNTLLDAGKTGLCLKPEAFQCHQQAFHASKKRRKALGPYILDSLYQAGDAKRAQLLSDYERTSRQSLANYQKMAQDTDLIQPYLMARDKSQRIFHGSQAYKSELAAIVRHIEAVRKLYNSTNTIKEPWIDQKPEQKTKQKAERAAAALAMHKKFAEVIPEIELMDVNAVEELKASYAYYLAENFGFTVAFKTLCTIKARATPGGIAPSSRLFDELKTISGAASRATLDNDDF